MKAHWSAIYDLMEEDWKMYYLDQWKDTEKAKRENQLPMITDDFCRPYVKQVIANTYQNPQNIKLDARNDAAALKAKALSEAIRYIENASDSGDIKSHAIESAAVAGLGYIKVNYTINEVNENAQPVEIKLEKIIDPLMVYLDDKSVEIDGSDARDAVEFMSQDNYIYYKKDSEGTVRWYEVKGEKIVEEDEFPSTYIPLVPVYGEMGVIKGERSCFGIIRALKDIQREHNFTKSDALTRLSLTPQATVIAEEDSLTSEQEQRLRNNTNVPETLIKYKGISEDGLQKYNPPVQSMMTPNLSAQQSQLASIKESAKASTGIYTQDEQLNQESGVAIVRKQMGSDRGQLVYDAHLKSSQKHIGTILLQMIEQLYTPLGFMPIQNEQGVNNQVYIGQPQFDQMGNPIPTLPNITISDASITISAQPAYTTRKDEGVSKMFELLPTLAPEMQVQVLPELIKDLGFPNAERYAAIISGNPEGGEVDPQMVQQNMAQMQQQMQQLQMQLEQANNANLQLQTELKTQSQTALAKAQMDNQTKIQLKHMDIQAKAVSDDKDLYSKEVIHNRDVDTDVMKEMNKRNMQQDKLQAEAEADNKKLVVDTMNDINQGLNPLI